MLKEIANYIQQIAEVISEVIKLDVTIVDKDTIRIAGTGRFMQEIGQRSPIGSAIYNVEQKGARISIFEPGKEKTCSNCKIVNTCKSTARMISPILESGKVEGFLVIDAFNDEQRQILLLAEDKYLNFISQMSDLIANKLALNKTLGNLSAIINSVHEGIIAIDDTGAITLWNAYAKMSLNTLDKFFENKKVSDIFHLNFKDLENVLQKGQDIIHKEIISVDSLGGGTFICNVHPIFSCIEVIGALLMFREMKEVNKLYSGYISGGSNFAFDGLIGDSVSMKGLKEKALRIAKNNSTVMIRGESGTGKELLARAIHSSSSRKKGPFIVINCGAIPESLLESELFGYDDGAFTGAKKGGKPGKFELANGGTLFLDEIGDMQLHLQVKILRVLQDGVYYRVGGRKEEQCDVRVIAATHRNLEQLIEEGKFREDLYYRLNVVPLYIPPLRERNEDIETLLNYYLKYYNKVLNKEVIDFDSEVKDYLCKYRWPGNVRELQNLVEYTMNMVDSNYIKFEHVPSRVLTPDSDGVNDYDKEMNLEKIVERTYKQAVTKYGRSEEGKIQIAEALGVSRSTVYRKLREYGL
ncbi:MAG: sigma 54-interacting transcriptional regulator [Dehalobacterium sp.]